MTSRAWLIVAAAGLVAVLLWRNRKAARLNRDPLQQELVMLLEEAIDKDFSHQAKVLFDVSCANAFDRQTITREGERRARLAHALSKVRPTIPPSQYQELQQFLRSI